MNRKELDALAAHHRLGADAVESMMALAVARPAPSEMRRFGVRVLQLAGVLSLAAGVVFFVAANWGALSVLGRFVLVEALLVLSVGVALWRPAPHAVGRYALLLAFIVSGALLALFGQTYQAGADVYETFLDWALLGLALVVAAQWSVVWAAWALVLNVSLWLYCGARPEAGPLWVAFSFWDLDPARLLLVPLVVDVVLWLAALRLQRTRWSALAPTWLARFVLACAVGVGTWSGMLVVLRDGRGEVSPLGLVVPLVAFAGIAARTLRQKVDVFPLAAIEGSLILLSTVWLARVVDFDDAGVLFVLSAWLIVTSAVSGRYLMRLVRAWEATS
jgi:uncharacterized membrane protein